MNTRQHNDLTRNVEREEQETGNRPAAGAGGGYVWEEEYKRSWDLIQEDERGTLQAVVETLQRGLRRKRQARQTAAVQRGIIRHCYVILDQSKAMLQTDMMPSNLELCLQCLEAFVHEFFDQNPISQLGIITTSNGLAHKLTELSGNPNEHIRALRRKETRDCVGEPSLQNALEMARASLAHLPHHGSREVLVVMGSLTTCDPGNVRETIRATAEDGVRAMVLGLAAQVRVLGELADVTNGTYAIPLNEAHLKELFQECVPPLPLVSRQADTSACLVMGFPARLQHPPGTVVVCACHSRPTLLGFACPRCRSKVCELPTECPVCALVLVSSPHLARSYHHVFPVPDFAEVRSGGAACRSCRRPFDSGASINDRMRFQCPRCESVFCYDCDAFAHETLHNCPGCASRDHGLG